MNGGQGGRSLAPIFAKKKPRLALLAHPNNAQSTNDHISQPQSRGLKRQNASGSSYASGGSRSSYQTQQYEAQAPGSFPLHPGPQTASYSSSHANTNFDSSFGMTVQPTGFNGAFQATNNMTATSQQGAQYFSSNQQNGDQGMQNFTPGMMGQNMSSNQGMKNFGMMPQAGPSHMPEQDVRNYQAGQPVYQRFPSNLPSNQPMNQSFTSNQPDGKSFMAGEVMSNRYVKSNVYGQGAGTSHTNMQGISSVQSRPPFGMHTNTQVNQQTWCSGGQNMQSGGQVNGGVPAMQKPKYGQQAWGYPSGPFGGMQQQCFSNNQFNPGVSSQHWNSPGQRNTTTTFSQPAVMGTTMSHNDADPPSSTTNKSKNDVKIQPKKSAPEKSLRMITATVQGMKHWSQYRSKIPLLFEVLGQLTSAVTGGSNRITKEFVIKDDKQSVSCVFHEIDRTLPQLIRGQWYRCIGSLEPSSNKFRCVSIRNASETEIKMHKVFVTASDRTMRTVVAKTREL